MLAVPRHATIVARGVERKPLHGFDAADAVNPQGPWRTAAVTSETFERRLGIDQHPCPLETTVILAAERVAKAKRRLVPRRLVW